jgi:FSR family fosmidomycin resistance protein-like MFS transporter
VFNSRSKTTASHAVRRAGRFTLTILAVEFVDELTFGAESAILPVIRTELGLSYAQVGVLLSLPMLIGNLIEPAIGILGDIWKRKAIVIGGGLMFALAALLVGHAQDFSALLIAFAIFAPASGAFVNLSQATLMDLHPSRQEQMMARWTLAGSLGVVCGPLLMPVAFGAGLGWRALFVAFAVSALALVWSVWRQPDFNGKPSAEEIGFLGGVKLALHALRSRGVLRWLILLESADLLLDIFLGFVALYFVDVVRASEAQAALAVAVWSTASLIGDALIIPVLERIRGLSYLRWSAFVTLTLYAALLTVPDTSAKYVLLAGLAFGTSGWYAILKGQLYTAMPGQSGITMTVSSISGVVAGLIPLGLGLIAQRFGLAWMMALLALGPISLLVGLPRKR